MVWFQLILELIESIFNLKSILFKLIPLLLLLLIIIVFSINLNSNNDSKDKLVTPLIGKKLPVNKIKLLNNEVYFNLNNYKSIFAVNFFASWCLPCKVEAPIIERLSKKIPVFGIAFKDNNTNTIEFLKTYGNPYNEIGIDTDGMIGIEWGVYGIPETFIINKKGEIIYKFTGPLTINELNKNIIMKITNEK